MLKGNGKGDSLEARHMLKGKGKGDVYARPGSCQHRQKHPKPIAAHTHILQEQSDVHHDHEHIWGM